MDYKEQIKERIKILPEQLKNFVLDENWRKEAENIGKEWNFDEEKYASFENEVFLVLLCFEPKRDFKENIKREAGIDPNIAGPITDRVYKGIFDKIASGLEIVERQIEENEKSELSLKQKKPTEISPKSSVGESFEQIILNQARAMQPAAASPKLDYGVMKPAQDEQRQEVPPNLPTEPPQEDKKEEKAEKPEQVKVPNYSGYPTGQDPYREPLE